MTDKVKAQLEPHLVKIRDKYSDDKLDINELCGTTSLHYDYVILGHTGKLMIKVVENELAEITYFLYPDIGYEWER